MSTIQTPRRNRAVIALVATGSVILLVLVALVFLQLGRSTAGDRNAAAPAPTTPSAPGDAARSAAPVDDTGAQPVQQPAQQQPAPVNTAVRFTAFTADPTVECDPTGEAERPTPSISWSSANAVAAYWTPSANPADADNGYAIPVNGNQDDMSASKGAGESYTFPCNHRQTLDTTITLVGADGSTVSKTVTFTDVNWSTDDDE